MPRGVQTWVLAGLALFMLVMMLVVGRPSAPARPASGPAAAAQTPSSDRVRDYQARLKAAEERALAEVQAAEQTPAPIPGPARPRSHRLRTRSARTGGAARYESLFASNVVLSRRPDAERPDAGRGSPAAGNSAAGEPAAVPTMDEIADAAVRATARAGAIAHGPLGQCERADVAGAGRTERRGDSGSGRCPTGRTQSAQPVRCTGSSRAPSSTRSCRIAWTGMRRPR